MSPTLPQPAPSRARTLEAGKRWARLAQARAASRPGLFATAPGRRAGAPLLWQLTEVPTSEFPWGISETAYNELDDARNYKYHAFGVPYLKFQNTTPDRIVVSPYSSLMAIGVDDRAVYDNILRFKALNMYDQFGFYESYDEEDHVPVKAHYAHHQGMILASLANYLSGNCLQHYFMQEPAMRSMDTLLKEKAQVKPYIDLKGTQYKRYQYSKVQTESDARDFDTIANVPEIGVVSNGQ